MPRVHLPRRVRIRVVVRVHIPPVPRHLHHRVPPLRQQPPESLGVVRPARKAASHSDDRDRLVAPKLFGRRRNAAAGASAFARRPGSQRVLARASMVG